MSRLALLLLVSAGCIPPAATAPTYAAQQPVTGGGSGAGPDDAALTQEAAALAGGNELTHVMQGPASGSGHVFAGEGGRCYQIGVAANDAVSTAIVVHGGETAIYDAPYGNTGQGRGVAYTHCVDVSGTVTLHLVANQMVRPGEIQGLGQARFAIAAVSRPETTAERDGRHRTERERFVNMREAECDQMSASDGYKCMQELEAMLTELDARAVATP